MQKKDGKFRWHDSNEFKKRWGKRNEALYLLLKECDLLLSELRFVEYGCGPHKPFFNLCGKEFRSGVCCDTKQWEQDTFIVDLNNLNSNLPVGNIGVMSGVLEYLNNPRQVLEKIIKNHEFLLFSYLAIDNEISLRDKLQGLFKEKHEFLLKKIKQRTANGIRNHFDIAGIFNLIEGKAYIENIGNFNNQILLLLSRY
jgi:hypothetical protein